MASAVTSQNCKKKKKHGFVLKAQRVRIEKNDVRIVSIMQWTFPSFAVFPPDCKQVWMLRKVPKTSKCSLVMSQ